MRPRPNLEFSGLLDRFDEDWQDGAPPDLADYLPDTADPATRRAALVELIMIDLERRWMDAAIGRRRGEQPRRRSLAGAQTALPARPRLEDYARRFSELGAARSLPLELICEEYRVRTRAGDNPARLDYVDRFPSHDRLTAALERIDREWSAGAGAEREMHSPVRRFEETLVHRNAAVSGETHTVGRGETSRAGETPPPPSVPRGLPRDFGDYELLDEIARGGMGVVFRARQKKANRVVALKMILGGDQANDEEIKRFHAEVEAAANLEHLGIVRIYDVGEWRGQPYFSMAFVDGPSLKDQIAEHPLPPREAAEHLRFIASAIAYAHEKGIVHRDLKPANILLENGTEPRVTDFGLAKRLHADSQLTVAGQVMGTPSYMAPEQAAGDNETVGTAADVYALGAVLYTALAGRPPFQAATIPETLRQVVEQQPVPPRHLNPTIPLDLQTICLKCLEKNPHSRYASAELLADELQRYLDRKPILARPVTRLEHVRRWVVRNPIVSSLSAAVVLSLVLGLLVSLGFANAKRRESARLFERTQELQRSQEDMKRTIDGYVETVVNNRFLSNRQFRPTLRQLLSDAQVHYGRLVENFRGDTGQLAELERAVGRLGDMNRAMGDSEKSALAYREAMDLTRRLIRLEPQRDHRRRLAERHLDLGEVYARTGDFRLAKAEYQDGLAILRDVLAEDNAKTEAHLIFNGCLYRLAHAHRALGDFSQATEVVQEAIETARRLAEATGRRDVQYDLSRCYDFLATCYLDDRDHERSLEALGRAQVICDQLLAADPGNGYFRAAHSDLEVQLGRVQISLGRFLQGLEHLKAGLEVRQEMAASNPLLHSAQYRLAESHHYLGVAYRSLGQVDDAISHARQATLIGNRLAGEDGAVRAFQSMVVGGHLELGKSLHNAGRYEQAIASYQAALDASRNVVRPTWSEHLPVADVELPAETVVESNLSRTLIAMGRYQAGVQLSEQVARVVKDRVDRGEATIEDRASLARAQSNLGTAYSELGRLDEAVRELQGARDAIRPLTEENAETLDWLIQDLTALTMLGTVQLQMGELREGMQRLTEAREESRQMHQRYPESEEALTVFATCATNFATAQFMLNRFAAASEAADVGRNAFETLRQRNSESLEHAYGLMNCHKILGEVGIRTRNAELGIEHFQAVIDLCRSIPQEFRTPRTEWLYGHALSNQGAFFRQQDRDDEADANFSEAIAVLERILEEAPGQIEFRTTLSLALANQATLRRDAGQYDQAIDSIERAVREAESVLHAQSDYPPAVETKSRLLEYQAYCYLSRAWRLATSPIDSERDGAQAMADAEKGCRIGNEHWSRLDTLAAAYAEAGEFERAVETAKKAIALVPFLQRSKANELRARLQLYEMGQPYRQPPAETPMDS